jgi:hypothetical protein
LVSAQVCGPTRIWRNVAGIAHDGEVTARRAADVTGQHEPGVDAEVHLEGRREGAVLQQARQTLAHLDGRIDGTPGCVLERLRSAEERHHTVADVLVDPSPVPDDDLLEQREAAVHRLVHVFRVELLAHGGEAREVGEQHRGVPAGTARALLLPRCIVGRRHERWRQALEPESTGRDKHCGRDAK